MKQNRENQFDIGKSSIDVAQAVRAEPALASVQIIAVTGYSMAGDRDKILTGASHGTGKLFR